MVKGQSIELQIGKLSLHGFSAQDARRIGRALEAELTRLLTQEGIPPHLSAGGTVPRMKGAPLKIAGRGGAEKIGSQIARSIYQGTGGSKKNK